MQAIDTLYGGYRFRSRLEARWAVFFDAAGIEYQYEPEGFELEWRLEPMRNSTFKYLPDFWLPELGLWAEVKGRWTVMEEWRFLNAAASLSEHGNDVVILGDTFRQPRRGSTVPYHLHWTKGVLFAKPWEFVDIEPGWHEAVATDDGGPRLPDFRGSLLDGRTWPVALGARFQTALAEAQSCRFEFGDTLGGVRK